MRYLAILVLLLASCATTSTEPKLVSESENCDGPFLTCPAIKSILTKPLLDEIGYLHVYKHADNHYGLELQVRNGFKCHYINFHTGPSIRHHLQLKKQILTCLIEAVDTEIENAKIGRSVNRVR